MKPLNTIFIHFPRGQGSKLSQNPDPDRKGLGQAAALRTVQLAPGNVGSSGDSCCLLFVDLAMDQYLYIPFVRGMTIHLPAILMFTRGIGFWPIPIYVEIKWVSMGVGKKRGWECNDVIQHGGRSAINQWLSQRKKGLKILGFPPR